MRCDSIDLQLAEVRRAPREAIGDRRQHHTLVDGSRVGPQPKIKIIRIVDVLKRARIPRIECGDVHEYVVSDLDTVPVLPGRLTVFLERRELDNSSAGL